MEVQEGRCGCGQPAVHEGYCEFHFTPEQLEQQKIGAQQALVKMLGRVGIQWNGAGVEQYIRRELKELGAEQGELR